jgi:hypothetical protein
MSFHFQRAIDTCYKSAFPCVPSLSPNLLANLYRVLNYKIPEIITQERNGILAAAVTKSRIVYRSPKVLHTNANAALKNEHLFERRHKG